MQRDILLLTEMIDAAEQAQQLTANVTVSELESDRQRCLTCRALARRTRPLLWSHALLRKGPLPGGKGP
jgi:hypothetical protein